MSINYTTQLIWAVHRTLIGAKKCLSRGCVVCILLQNFKVDESSMKSYQEISSRQPVQKKKKKRKRKGKALG